MIFVRQFAHFKNIVLQSDRRLFVADELVVDTQVELFAFFFERIRDETLVIPRFLPVTVPVVSTFLHVVIGIERRSIGVLDKFLVLLCSVSQEVPHVQLTMSTSQKDKQTLHCALGSLSKSSHN